jgi:cellulose synthase/poly-beta-1,6-N-acetylglucosamine synthase-like glycosyltransferase
VLRLIALFAFVGLLAIWAIYPLVIAALAAVMARRRGSSVLGGDEPVVSVIIATRADAEITRRRIADCLESDYDPTKLEIVVAIDSQAGENATRDLGIVADNVKVVAGDLPGGKAAALNAAARACRGDVLVFTDVHQRFRPDAIRRLVAALGDPQVGAVSGSLEIPNAGARRSVAERYWLFERWLRSREAIVHSSVGVTGAIWAMRSSLWNPLPDFLINDDVYTPLRIVLRGYRVAFAREAQAFETRRHEPAEEYLRKVRTLTGVIQVCSWLPGVLSPTQNPIWTQFVFHKLLRFLTPYLVVAIAVWAAVTAGSWLGTNLIAVAGVVLCAIAASYFANAKLARSLWETVVSSALLQAATVVGAINGLRGRWNVWATPVRASGQK